MLTRSKYATYPQNVCPHSSLIVVSGVVKHGVSVLSFIVWFYGTLVQYEIFKTHILSQ